MRTIENILQAASKIDLPFLIEDSLYDNAKAYVDLQKDQMFAGEASDGKQIHRLDANYEGYAPRTIAEKKKKGQPFDRVTLKDKSDFYNGIYAEARSEGFAVDSTDPKSEKLMEDYGEKIFGLADQRKESFRDLAHATLIGKVIQKLNNSSVSVSRQTVNV